MIRSLLRVLAFVQRFLVGFSNLDPWGTIKLFVIYRSQGLSEPTSAYLKKPQRRFYFRGAADRGVMSHFYQEGFRIWDDDSESKVRFIIDAGANIGDETVRFRYFHPEAIIVALEPEIGNFRLLQLNTQGDPNIVTVNKGLWSKVCKLKIVPGTVNEDFKVVEVDDPDETYDILATSIDQLIGEHGVSEIDILKMDIEGAEKQVFESATAEWLSKVKVFIFECPDNDSPGTTMTIFKTLLAAGLKYNCYLHGENIILIRQDVAWTLRNDLFFQR